MKTNHPQTTDKLSILGIGTDIIEIDRIRNAIEKCGKHFINRIFTPQEQRYCEQYKDKAPYFAARFAAKEAVIKALGIGFGKKASFLNIEVVREKGQKPEIKLSSSLRKRFPNPKILLSMSHCKKFATATAIYLINTS